MHRQILEADLELQRSFLDILQLAVQLNGPIRVVSFLDLRVNISSGFFLIAQFQCIVALRQPSSQLFELVLALKVDYVEFPVALLVLHKLTELERSCIVEFLDIEQLCDPLIVALHHFQLLLNELSIPFQLQLLLSYTTLYRFLLNL